MENKFLKELLLGLIKVHILHHASKGRIYGKEFSDELLRHGYKLSYGTIYPLFHKLENDGYLNSENEKVNGKVRRYYSITKEGRKILKAARNQANELVEELFEN